MTRIRTGIARRPDGPEDANPMNRRLPAEVVSRRKGENRAHPGKAVKEEVAPSHLSTDLKQVLAMKPEARSKWLAKAVQQAHPQDGRLSPKSIYDIIAHAKFANDLNEKMGQRMYRVLHANLSLFSTKQQKFLEKECALAKQFAVAAFAPVPGAEEEDTTAADAMEDMMARCRAFVRERQSERGERNIQEGATTSNGEEAEAEAAEAAEIPPVGTPQALQAPDAKQATQDEAAELREANAETPFEQPISQAEPQKEVEADGPLTRASKSRSRSRSSPSKTKDATAGSQEKDVKDAKDEASKLKKASKPESKENGKGKTSEKPKSKEGKDTKDTKASDKAKKSKDEVSRDQSRDTKTKNAKSYKEKAKESRRRENHKRGRARDESESSRSRRRSDKRRGKKSRNSSDSSSFVSRKRGRSSSSRPRRR
ncbi:unnamed protein product [Cladocopium goreaui]|uniref:Intraflagellar transport protein 80-like n=1 Tax=Cladocopium goreaui TaxID=2562237 RepID=A0A9P1GNT8_9DINO|nr:unnamed protein product [Cladocopium goreaui]